MPRVKPLLALAVVLAAPALAADPKPKAAGAPAPAAAQAADPAAPARAALERLKGLAGEWTGQAGPGEVPPARVRWEVISAGTAVMETLFPGTEHEMRSVYDLDGKDLVMTHYCAMGNQPRLRLAPGQSGGDLVFEFVGGSNIDPAKDGHVHSGVISIRGDELRERWGFHQAGKQAGEHQLLLTRAR